MAWENLQYRKRVGEKVSCIYMLLQIASLTRKNTINERNDINELQWLWLNLVLWWSGRMDGRGGEGQKNFDEVKGNGENDNLMKGWDICSFKCSLQSILVYKNHE